MKKHIATGAATYTRESRTLPGEGRSFFFENAAPGALIGVIGGTVMLLIYGAFSLGHGQGFLALPKMISGMFLRDLPSIAMPGWTIFVGLLIHYTVAVHVGIAWALCVPRHRDRSTWSTGAALIPISLLFASVVYLVLNLFVMPYASPPMARELMPTVWLIAHLAFGLTLLLILPMRASRWVNRHRARELPIRPAPQPLPVSSTARAHV